MALIDEVTLELKAGDGGNGIVSWRHEKFKPKAGPGGGDGGEGGDLYAESVSDLAYLEYYKQTRKFAAEKGVDGQSLGKKGRNGNDLTLRFPRGTVLKNMKTGQEFELGEPGEKIMILKGGRGGFGNEYFKSSTNTTPMEWTPGKIGEEASFFVELRLFADAGFVGLPSAGKSTLLNALTNAKSKVAAYHFTTLDPHLGALGPYILADIPGIIEGASQGRGLGFKFLRHVRRTEMLVHVVSLESEDPYADYLTIRKEIAEYDEELAQRKEIVLLSKTDMVDEKTLEETKELFIEKINSSDVYSMTAFDDESINLFRAELSRHIAALKKAAEEKAALEDPKTEIEEFFEDDFYSIDS